jgi:hypothetical protein
MKHACTLSASEKRKALLVVPNRHEAFIFYKDGNAWNARLLELISTPAAQNGTSTL